MVYIEYFNVLVGQQDVCGIELQLQCVCSHIPNSCNHFWTTVELFGTEERDVSDFEYTDYNFFGHFTGFSN